MANAKRDKNGVPTLLGVSNVDGETPVVLWADPVTHRLLVDASVQSHLEMIDNKLLSLENQSNNVQTTLGTMDNRFLSLESQGQITDNRLLSLENQGQTTNNRLTSLENPEDMGVGSVFAVRRRIARTIHSGLNSRALFNATDPRFERNPTATGLSMNIVGTITNNSGRDLTVMASYKVNWDTNNVGVRTAYIAMNENTTIRLAQSTVQAVSIGTVQNGSAVFLLPNGQSFGLYLWQNSGGNRHIAINEGAGLASGFGTIMQVTVIK